MDYCSFDSMSQKYSIFIWHCDLSIVGYYFTVKFYNIFEFELMKIFYYGVKIGIGGQHTDQCYEEGLFCIYHPV